MSAPALQNGTHPRALFWFLGTWTLINALQAFFTELAHDEAYYWMWSLYPAIGYFDHPPMVALFVKAGYALLQNELGVRLATVLTSTAVLYYLYRLTGPEKLQTLAMIIAGTLLVHIGGFFAAPDSPLVFFITIFYLLWKKYLDKDSWTLALFLAIVIALVMYSKYLAVLALFCTVAANPFIWRRPSFWFMILGSIALYTPHLAWLFAGEGYAVIEHNLDNRITNPWSINEILSYVGGQLLVTGPLVGILTIYAAIRQPAVDPFVRSMKFAFAGVFGFFLLLSFRGHIEANWTASVFTPLIFLATMYIHSRQVWRRWLLWLSIPSLALIVIVRLHIITGFLPIDQRIDKTSEFRGWEHFTEMCEERAGANRMAARVFQDAAKMSFYSDEIVPSLMMYTREDQYTFWRLDTLLEGEDVTYFTSRPEWTRDTIPTPSGGRVFVYDIENFRVYNDVAITSPIDTITVAPGGSTTILIDLQSPARWDGPVAGHKMFLACDLMRDGYTIHERTGIFTLPQGVYGSQVVELPLWAPSEPGIYDIGVYLITEGFVRWNAVVVGTIIVL